MSGTNFSKRISQGFSCEGRTTRRWTTFESDKELRRDRMSERVIGIK